MKSITNLFRCLGVAAVLFAVACPTFSRGDDETPIEDNTAAEKPADRYQVPQGDVEKLLEFIDGLKSFRATTAREFYEHRDKSQVAIKAAAEKILELAKDPDSDAHKKAKTILLLAAAQSIRGRLARRAASDC